MKKNVNVYQIVVNSEKRDAEKEHAFVRGMLGVEPDMKTFELLYDKVLSFDIDSEEREMLEICEFCFGILNDSCIYQTPEKYSLQIYKAFRSLSVGDFLEIDDKLYLVKGSGFLECKKELK